MLLVLVFALATAVTGGPVGDMRKQREELRNTFKEVMAEAGPEGLSMSDDMREALTKVMVHRAPTPEEVHTLKLYKPIALLRLEEECLQAMVSEQLAALSGEVVVSEIFLEQRLIPVLGMINYYSSFTLVAWQYPEGARKRMDEIADVVVQILNPLLYRDTDYAGMGSSIDGVSWYIGSLVGANVLPPPGISTGLTRAYKNLLQLRSERADPEIVEYVNELESIRAGSYIL